MTSEGWLCIDCRTWVDPGEELSACPKCGAPLMSRSAMSRISLSGLEEQPEPTEPAEVSAAAEKPENVLGDFVLLEEMGSGGMGIVHRAWDRDTHRYVALKVLKDSKDTHVARFVREAHATTRLSHPHIVKVFRTGESGGRHFMAMELIEGRSLGEILESAERPEMRETVRILLKVCRAIRHAHSRGIVHRDVKPDNILLDPEGNPYVVDFGLSRVNEPGWSVTLENQAIGTPQYMSPEQVRGGEPSRRPSTDIYSLGAVLYHMLTGRPPAEGKTPFEVMESVSRIDPDRPSRIRAEVHEDLETICLKCLEKDSDRRYTDIRALETDLTNWLDGKPIQARPVSWVYRLRKYVGRRRAMLIPTAAAVAIVLGLGVWLILDSVDRSRRIREGVERADDLEKRSRYSDARDEYRRVLELDPRHHVATMGMERTSEWLKKDKNSLLDAASRSEALRVLERARPVLESAFDSRYDPGADYPSLAKRAAEAQKLIREALKIAPDLSEAHGLMGRAWEILGHWDKAEKEYRKAVEADDRYVPARFHLGRLLLVQSFMAGFYYGGEWEKSFAAADRLATEGAKLIEEAVHLGGIPERPLLQPLALGMVAMYRQEYAVMYGIVNGVIQKHGRAHGVEDFYWLRGTPIGNWDRAEFFTKGLEIAPNHVPLLLARAVVHRIHRRFPEATRDIDRAFRFGARFETAYQERGSIRMFTGRYEEALVDFNTAEKLGGTGPRIWINRGNLYTELGRHDEAMEDFDRAIREMPNAAQAFVGRSRVFLARGDAKNAVLDCDRALEIDPKLETAWNNRGVAWIDLGEYEKAYRDISRAIELNDRYANAYRNRIKVLLDQKQYAEALQDADRALKLEPDNPELRYGRASSLYRLGRIRQALAEIEMILKIRPTAARERFFRARCRRRLGDLPAAREELDELIALHPKNADYLVVRGHVRAETGDRRGAIGDYRLALDVAPREWARRAHAKKSLEALED